MTPSRVLQVQIATLIAHDTTSLANAIANGVHLAKQPFVPTPDLDITTLVEADFAGYAVLTPTAGNQLIYQDPITGLYTVELVQPAGGWHFQTTGAGNLPQTIYGWWVANGAGAVLYGAGLLDVPVPLSITGQGFDLPRLIFAFSNNSPN